MSNQENVRLAEKLVNLAKKLTKAGMFPPSVQETKKVIRGVRNNLDMVEDLLDKDSDEKAMDHLSEAYERLEKLCKDWDVI